MKTFHRDQQTGHTDEIFEEIPAMISDDLRWSAMILETQICRKIVHFIGHQQRRLSTFLSYYKGLVTNYGEGGATKREGGGT